MEVPYVPGLTLVDDNVNTPVFETEASPVRVLKIGRFL